MTESTIIVGDCLETMRDMADASVHCCVTSPPYFGLRDYGHAGQIGLEPTPSDYVAKMVGVFREVRRVLREDGTLWLNLGDSYASNPASGGAQSSRMTGGEHRRTPADRKYHRPDGIKPKDLLGIPWTVAFALRADGWYLRQDIIWHKPNPMPESVRDRCTKSHEHIFLLSKSERYHYDADAVSEESTGRACGNVAQAPALADDKDRHRTRTNLHAVTPSPRRNRRDVWTIATRPFRGAHFATFPEKLVEPCILAGCPEGGTVLDPFGGAGTVGVVAQRHGRNSTLLELNPAYAEIARKRIDGARDLFTKTAK